MTKTVFIDFTCLFTEDHEPVKHALDITNAMSEHYVVVIFTDERENARLAFNETLMDHEVPCEDLLMRGDDDWSKAVVLRQSFIVDYFDGDIEKAVDNSVVMINYELTIEALREEGFFVMTTGWC